MPSLPRRVWAWLFERRRTVDDPRDEVPTRAERQRQMLDDAEHPLDQGFPSGDYGRQQPFQ